MAIDFTIPVEVDRLRSRVRDFVRDEVAPREARIFADGGPDDEVRLDLQARAREAGLLSPHLPTRWGGLGLDVRGQSIVFEEAGWALLGPLALNCAAPDEGNGHLLSKVGTPEQQERYLGPLARGEIRTAFAMTEPPPGAGSDPSALATTARQVAGGWRIDGEKRFITGADGAAVTICMARHDDRPGATMFLVEADNPGLRLVRHMETIDRISVGGHAVVRFEDCFVPDDAVLGEVGKGFRNAQVRLGPARLTHCMRWLGAARRAHDIAVEHAADRRLFGDRLADHGMARQVIADNVIDLTTAQTLIWRAAWALDSGDPARDLTSIAKVQVSEAVGRIVDRSVQLAGGLGVAEESLLGRIYIEVRPFRVYDGPSEAHRWALARRVVPREEGRP
ncbi:acyl-CoA dehydrogenase family protein [Phytohabitans kaempferiae]|uniref:Acyl-CoA dehydrogenase family protein n=1 Tax=Phytohabitans kaempferiae TaxID=1620943 RepID=A0ABV6LXF2_9ACTN